MFSLFLGGLGVYIISYDSYILDIFFPYSFLREINLSFCFDFVSLFFFIVVSLISGVVFLYSKFYLNIFSLNNSDNNRFLFLLFLFVVSIIFLVFSNSWVRVILGWDGLGIVSFLLVIYYNSSSSLDSGLITVFTNRLGDCLFILSFIFIFYCGWLSVDYLSLSNCLLFICFIGLGAITKRAQAPFSSWLPAAIAAPTPVSSLVHSSTLVTAGVYLIIRFNYLLADFFFLLGFISLFTIFVAGVRALLELDFKKVVAISTLSQLGFILFSVCSGYWFLCYFHIIFHAFFKRVLFLSTGSLIHLILGDQDSRSFGTMGSSFFSKLFFNISCLSLIGFPFTLGFYRKDIILGFSLFYDSRFIVFLFLLSCCFTVAYSLRLIYMGYFNFPSYSASISFLEEGWFYLPIFLLFFSCVFLGNFYFYFFFLSLCFRFIDFFMGLVIIGFGFILFWGFCVSYYFFYLFCFIFYLSLLSTRWASIKIRIFSYKFEYTWGEILGAIGVKLIINKASYRRLSSSKLEFVLIPLFFLFFTILIFYVFSP